MLEKLNFLKINNIVDYSKETNELTIEMLMSKGFSAYEASAYLNKLKIQKIIENDMGGKNEFFNKDLQLPADRMKDFVNKNCKNNKEKRSNCNGKKPS